METVFLSDACGWLRNVAGDIIIDTDIKELKARDVAFLTLFSLLGLRSNL
jgi:hypothetical protein